MRIGFRLLLAGAIVLGLGLGTGLAAYQSSQQSASGAATGAPVASAAQNGAGQPAAQTGSGQAATQRGGMPAIGVVASVGDKEFSLKSESTATPVLVRLADQTAIRKQVAGTLSDIRPGETISVRGEASSDGAIAATTVQLVTGDAGMALPGVQRQAPGQGAPSGAPGGGGMAPAGAQGQARGQSTPGAAPFGGGSRAQGGSGTLIGTVKEVAGNVVSVARSGGQGAAETLVKVTLSDQTAVAKTVAGDVKDIAAGAYVMVVGSRGADGAITATSVQILPPEAAGMMSRQQ